MIVLIIQLEATLCEWSAVIYVHDMSFEKCFLKDGNLLKLECYHLVVCFRGCFWRSIPIEFL